MKECQFGRYLGIVDTEGINTTRFVESQYVSSMLQTISINWGDILDDSPLTLHRDWANRWQERKYSISHINNSQLALTILYRYQITVKMLCFVTYETVITMLRKVIMQWAPGIK